MADPTTALLVIAGAAEGGKALFQTRAGREKQQELDLIAKQNTLSYQEKTLSNFEVTDRVLKRQIAQATTRGISLGSGSFEALQRDTLNKGAKTGRALDLEKSLMDRNIENERKNVKTTLFAQLFGDVAEAGSSFALYKTAKGT